MIRQRAPSVLTFREVAACIEKSRNKALSPASIAAKLSRGFRLVEKTVEVMLERGLVCSHPNFSGTCKVLSLTGRQITPGGVEPFGPCGGTVLSADTPPPEPLVETDDKTELERAERLWAARMGSMRWHDDPRASAEPWNPVNYRGAFAQ